MPIIKEWYNTYKTKPIIVSGGAFGVDTLALMFGMKWGFERKVFKADWNTFGKAAGPMRNTKMAEYADFLIAFPSKDSKGTLDMIEQAKQHGLVVKVIDI